jgi:AraC-like DNA-binding protein
MKDTSHIELDNLLYSCIDEKVRGNEQYVCEHALGYIISGETHIQTPDGTKVFGEGQIGLVRRNLLVKSIKVPPAGGEFKSINIFLDQDFLRKYWAENGLSAVGKYTGSPIVILPPDPYIKGYFNSLMPYFENNSQPKPVLADIKTTEAVELLLRLNPDLKYFLFDFTEPYKIDLEAYMNKHFMFNVPMAQFAKLTGRSLASFKRDFEKVFQEPPGQWLQKKRLSEAHYLISEKGRKPSEVYMDVGFENLSHFSYSFKKAYGIAPSMVA